MDTVSPCPHFVYELIDPRDNAVFYVGITIDLYARYRQHMHCDGINVLKDAHIQEIRDAGYLPIMRRLELVENAEQARTREQYWIRHYTSLDIALCNAEVQHPPKPKSQPVKFAHHQPYTPETLGDGVGRRGDYPAMIALLQQVFETGKWPEHIKPQMRRYYRREYPEYFATSRSRKSAAKRLERQQHAERVLEDRKRRGRDKAASQAV